MPGQWSRCSRQQVPLPWAILLHRWCLNDVFIVTGSNTSENHPIIALQMKDAVETKRREDDRDWSASYRVGWFRRDVASAQTWNERALSSALWRMSLSKKDLINHEFIANRTEGSHRFHWVAWKIYTWICRRSFRCPCRRYSQGRTSSMPLRRMARFTGAWAFRNYRMARLRALDTDSPRVSHRSYRAGWYWALIRYTTN